MLPYEILVGFRRTMCTCARGFAEKRKYIKYSNFTAQSVQVYQRNNLNQTLWKNDGHIDQIRRFHTQLLAQCQASPKDSESSGFEISTLFNDSSEEMTSSMNKRIRNKETIEELSKSHDLQSKSSRNIPETVKNWLFGTSERIPSKDIEKKFTEPKAFLHNYYVAVANETKIPQVLTSSTKAVDVRKKRVWSYTYDVKWPESKSFTSIGQSKSSASSSAALKVLYWLHLNNRIQHRLPNIYEKKDTLSILKAPIELKIDKEVLNKMNDFLDKREKNVEQILSEIENLEVQKSVPENAQLDRQHPISHLKVDMDMRNQVLQERLVNRKVISKPELPIYQFKSKIIEELENNQALVIKGDTGCGKTTQVPQFIIDYMTEKGMAAECSMVVTQPRRISAISLAQRIAYERGEDLGDVVGYQVRLQQVLPKRHGAILFCTTGVLLKKLQSNLRLEGCSHVIVDEAHERSVDTDMLLVLLKRAMIKNPSLKVIIMSATINADLFQNFLECNAIEVPGRLFPVEMNFLEDINRLGIVSHQMKNTNDDNEPYVDCDQVTDLLRWISMRKPPGAILCFLPGWGHINRIQNNLEEYSDRNQIVIPLHSRVPYETQSKIFEPTPDGKRKIILATDIAETGITVPDVVYVIDTACHKEVRWHESKGLSSIDTHWISKANLNQRKGRAGRVQSGESYHFITKKQYEELEAYPIPEVLRVSLEKTVLDAKTYSDENANNFLGSMPQPPRTSSVMKAVDDLQILGALDEDQNLTHLGKRIALFSIHPKLSKALVYGTIFQCLSPVTTISAALSLDSEIFHGSLDNKSRIRDMKRRFHPTSDHLAIAWIYAQWYSYFNRRPQDAYRFCKRNNLHTERMNILHKVRDINLEHLRETGLIQDVRYASNLESKENEFSVLDELVRGVLLAGMDQLLKHRDFDFKKGRFTRAGTSMITEDEAKAQLTPESVNYKRTKWPSPYLVYYQKTHHHERRTTLIRESSMLSPITALLFSQGRVTGSMYQDNNCNEEKVLLEVGRKENLNLTCDEETAKTLLRFRDVMWSIVQYYVKKNVDPNSLYFDESSDSNNIIKYKQEMLDLLALLLTTTSNSIDSTDTMDTTRPSLTSQDDGIYR